MNYPLDRYTYTLIFYGDFLLNEFPSILGS